MTVKQLTTYLYCMSDELTSSFAENVFDDKKMKKYLPSSTYKAIVNARENNSALEQKHLDIFAKALKKWARRKGVTRYTHWFQPLNDFTAEKRDSLTSLNKEGNAILKFRGKELTKGEGDASSFPNGGMRETFEARGITQWDCTSYAFIKGDCLCIPTTFCGFNGEALDKKTPLLRSCEALNKQSLRVLKLLGFPVQRVYGVVGAEQEYFLIDKDLFDRRKDLVYTGRTLFGAMPPKGQEFDDHYFSPPSDKVLRFMRKVDKELWKLGIIVKTEHNEVAPCQCELVPCYTTANKACDHNQLIMETLKSVAEKQNLTCLLHEKPFESISGSGKHNNWSLLTDTDCNLFEAGSTPKENARFLLFLSAVIKAVDDYNDLLVASVASAGNERRLGGYEAPPQILTLYLGDALQNAIQRATNDDWKCGEDSLPASLFTTDRNRTSPFAFTGNKFEFRMVGSSASISDVNTALNTVVAESLRQFADLLEKSNNVWEKVKEIVASVFTEHQRVIFNGNGYSEEWLKEARERNLQSLSTVEAIQKLSAEKNIKVFLRHGILTRKEQLARQEILLENYCNTVNLESIVSREIYERQIAPAVETYVGELVKTADGKARLNLPNEAEKIKITIIAKLQDKCSAIVDKLNDLHATADSMPIGANKARLFQNEISANMNELRQCVNKLERICPKSKWALPTYGQLLFNEK